MGLTKLQRPITRHMADLGLVLVMDADGVTIRGYGRRNGRTIPWSRVFSLLESDGKSILIEAERAAGGRILESIRGRKGVA